MSGTLRWTVLWSVVASAVSVALAGGAREIDPAAGAVVWPTAEPVAYQVDLGTLGILSSSHAVQLINEAFATIEAVETASIMFQNEGFLPEDVDEDNWAIHFAVPGDGRSPIIFDTNGRILDELLGLTARNDIEGISRLELCANQAMPNDTGACGQAGRTELLEATVLINGACFDGLSDERSPCELTLDELRALLLHEAAHFCNLDHTDLNRQFDADGNPDNNAVLSTMYPEESEDDRTLVSLHFDDKLVLSTLYPRAPFPMSGGVISGLVLDPTLSPLSGANVVVRSLDEPTFLAASRVSGDEGGPGAYRFEGLPPGNYTVEVTQIASAFTGRISVGQTSTLLPGPAEFLSVADSAVDDPDDKVILTLHAGTELLGQDIVLNDISLLVNDQAGGGNNDFDNATLVSAGTLGDRIVAADVDYFKIPVPDGWSLQVDVDAADLEGAPGGPPGGGLDPVLGIFNSAGVVVTGAATVIPDPGTDELPGVGDDPALLYAPPAPGGVVVVAVGSVGDEDLDGAGGTTSGPYFLRLRLIPDVVPVGDRVGAGGGLSDDGSIFLSGEIVSTLGGGGSDGTIVELAMGPSDPLPDPDGDGLPDALDPCPLSADSDGDGVCDDQDNCMNVANALQRDGNDNGLGDVCDAPTVVEVLPLDGSFGVPLSASVEVRFSEPMDLASIGTPGGVGAIHLEGPGVTLVVSTGAVSADGSSVTLDPDTSLAATTDYTVVVPPSVTDLQAQPVSLTTAMFQTTAMTVAPAIPVDEIGAGVEGSTSTGNQNGDLYGSSVASNGDVDADGHSDLLVGAPAADGGATMSGEAVLLFGDDEAVSSGPTQQVRFHGVDTNDEAGASVTFVGDVNDDGYGDFLIGAPGARTGAVATGVAYLVFGQPDLRDVCSPVDLSGIANPSCEVAGPCAAAGPCGVILEGVDAGDELGRAVSGAGDFDHDGRRDLLLGAPGRTTLGRSGAGAVFLLYGADVLKSRGTVDLSQVGTAPVPGAVFIGENAGDAAGTALSDWRDRNEDGVDDILIGSPDAIVLAADQSTQIQDAGIAYAIFGTKDDPGAGEFRLSGSIDLRDAGVGGTFPAAVFLGETAFARIGFSVSGRRDVTGDGEPDILLGGPGMDFPDLVPGRVRVGGGVLVPSELVSGDDPIKKKRSRKVCLGTITATSEAASAGPESTLGAQFRDLLNAENVVDIFEGVLFAGEATDDEAGTSIRGVRDLNGDGVEDILLGAPGVDVLVPGVGLLAQAGRAYLILSQVVRSPGIVELEDVGVVHPGLVFDGRTASERLGQAVGGAGDLDATGTTEIVLGAPGDPMTPPNAGTVYVTVPVVTTEAANVEISGGAVTTVEWDSVPGAARHLAYRGTLLSVGAAGIFTSAALCLTDNGIVIGDADADGRPDFTDTDLPAPGDGYWYLISGANDLGEGLLGVNSFTGTLRRNDAPCL